MFTALDNKAVQIIAIHLPYVLELTSVWLSCDSNNEDDVYGAVIMASHCESSPGPLHECRLSARWPPTLKPIEPTWAVNSPVGYYDPHPPSPFIITQPESRYCGDIWTWIFSRHSQACYHETTAVCTLMWNSAYWLLLSENLYIGSSAPQCKQTQWFNSHSLCLLPSA